METKKEQSNNNGWAKVVIETKDKQQPKHTSEPWSDKTVARVEAGENIKMTFIVPVRLMSEENYQRSMVCVNAMKDKPDPQEYIRVTDKMAESYLGVQADNIELLAYKHACESINKDNPLAVAENLKEMFNFINAIKENKRGLYSAASESLAKKLLTKIQEGKQ